MDLRTAEGILGTGAGLLSDITLLAYIFLIVPSMLVGYVFARRKMFIPHHKLMMTGIVIFNWVLILGLMVTSYSDGVAPAVPDGLNDVRVWLPTLHLVIGAAAQLMATYLVLRMWLENVLPSALMVKNIKIYMRFTLAGWLITAMLGIFIYLTWYTDTIAIAGDDVPPPVSTEEALAPSTTEEAGDPITTEEATDDAEATPDDPDATEEVESAPDDPDATEEAESTPEDPDATEETEDEAETTPDDPDATEETD